MKNSNEYIEIFAKHDTYQTSSKSVHPLPNATISFYMKLLRIILYSNKWAKKGIYDRYKWVYSSVNIFRALERVGIQFEMEGMSNLTKTDKPAILVGNHMSTLETLILPGIVQPVRNIAFIMKSELLDLPLMGAITGARHPIVVGRTNPREDFKIVLNEGAKRLNDGWSIVVFPQKTRSPKFDAQSFNTIGIKLAKRNNVPVIPFALVTDAWENGKKIKDFGKIKTSKKVHFAFGEPLTISGSGAEEHGKVLDFIKQKILDWGRKELIVQQ